MKKLDSIQVLRAVAALLVVFCHAAYEITLNHPDVAPAMWVKINAKGLFGVDIFFVVSGFVMMYIISGQQSGGVTAARFIGDRIVRILPLYWVTTLLSVLAGLVLPAFKHKSVFTSVYVARSLLFIPSTNPMTGAPEPALGVGWTLNYEMFFYVVLALMLVLGVRRLHWAVLAVFSSLVALGVWFNPEEIILKSWTQTIILEFMFGVLLARARLSGFRIGTIWQVVLVCAGVVSWLSVAQFSIGPVNMRGVVWGLSAAAIFAGAVMGRKQVTYPRSITLIGDASYSLYLTHLFVMRSCSILAYHLPVNHTLQMWIFLAIFPPAAVAFSILSYRKFELPTLHFGRQLIQSYLNRNRRLPEQAL